MTEDERALLLLIAKWVAKHEEWAAGELGRTSNSAREIRGLIDKITQSDPAEMEHAQ